MKFYKTITITSGNNPDYIEIDAKSVTITASGSSAAAQYSLSKMDENNKEIPFANRRWFDVSFEGGAASADTPILSLKLSGIGVIYDIAYEV